MKKTYIVNDLPGFDGLSVLAEPIPRKIYPPGAEVELDDKVTPVRELLQKGIVCEVGGEPIPAILPEEEDPEKKWQ